MTERADFAAARRRDAGLPTLACPNCGALAAHWIPDSLTGPGNYTCTPTESSAA